MLRNTQGTPVAIPAAIAVAPGLAAPPILGVNYHQQTQNNWCWAACAQMVFEYYRTNSLQQCDLAGQQFGQSCCTNPSSAACDMGEWPENVYPAHNMGYTRINGAMSLADVTAEITARRPVEVYYAWTGGSSAHVALIVGVYDNGDVLVHDPWPGYGTGPRAFSAVQNAYNLGSWTISYSDIQPLAAVVASQAGTAAGAAAQPGPSGGVV